MSHIFDGIAAIVSHAVATESESAPSTAVSHQHATIAAATASFLDLPLTQAELLHALQTASENIMRLAGKIRANAADGIDTRADELAMTQQRALAHLVIDRLLSMPASPVVRH